MDSCRAVAIWLRITPAKRRRGSNAWQPSTSAATVRVVLAQLTTRSTGRSSSRASSAVEYSPATLTPSYRPRLPSITAKEQSCRCDWKVVTMVSGVIR